MNQPLSQSHPGGFYLGFIGYMDRKAAELLVGGAMEGIRNGYKEMHLIMSCLGGSVECGFYAAHTILAMPIKLVTYNVGDVASTGNLVFLAGATRFCIEGSTTFFHLTHAGAPPEGITNAVLKQRVRSFRMSDERITAYVANRTGKPVKDVSMWHRNDMHMDAAQALANGVAHGIKSPAIPGDAWFHQIILP